MKIIFAFFVLASCVERLDAIQFWLSDDEKFVAKHLEPSLVEAARYYTYSKNVSPDDMSSDHISRLRKLCDQGQKKGVYSKSTVLRLSQTCEALNDYERALSALRNIGEEKSPLGYRYMSQLAAARR